MFIWHSLQNDAGLMPDMMFKPLPLNLEGWLYKATNSIWSEYFASFATAAVNEKALDGFVETFLNALDAFPETVRNEIMI